MSTIDPADAFLVQRGTTTYQTPAGTLMSTIQPDDLFLINRGADSYKVTAEDVKGQLGSSGERAPLIEVLTPVDGAGVDDGTSILTAGNIVFGSTPYALGGTPGMAIWEFDTNQLFNCLCNL